MRRQDLYFAELEYRTLDDPSAKAESLKATGEFDAVFPRAFGCFAAAPPPDQMGRVVEFYHRTLDRYFYTASAGEITALEAGAFAGWTRTGKSFEVLIQPGCIPYGIAPVSSMPQSVYRFYGIPGIGPSSHFFTTDRDECSAVERSGVWLYEGSTFWATPPNSTGACPNSNALKVHRLWRPFGDSTHRLAVDQATIQEMQSKGWVYEGPVMCVRP